MKIRKSLCSDQITAELIQAGGCTGCLKSFYIADNKTFTYIHICNPSFKHNTILHLKLSQQQITVIRKKKETCSQSLQVEDLPLRI
jgi:hypothetical protein